MADIGAKCTFLKGILGKRVVEAEDLEDSRSGPISAFLEPERKCDDL